MFARFVGIVLLGSLCAFDRLMDNQAQNDGGLEFVPVCSQHNLGRLPEASIKIVPIEDWDICSMVKPDGSRCSRVCRTFVPASAVAILEEVK